MLPRNMMLPGDVHTFIFGAVKELIGEESWVVVPEARIMLLTIGMQESDFQYRRQLIGNHRTWWESVKGPATGFWQFEKTGVRGVLEHPASREHAARLCTFFGYPTDVNVIHDALVHNDILAAGFARLLLRTLPDPLPSAGDPWKGWDQYKAAWRPGKPRVERWYQRWEVAKKIVQNR